MMRKQRWTSLLCAAIIALSFLTGCGRPMVEKPQASIGGISTGSDKVIATVNGEQIKENIFMEWYIPTISMSGRMDLRQQLDAELIELIEMYKYTYLNGYIEQIVLLQEAKKTGIVVADSEVNASRDEIMKMYADSDEEKFKSVLQSWGFSDTSLRRFLKNQMMIQLLYTRITDSVTEPAQTPMEFFNENPDWFIQKETRLVRHILVGSLNDAMETIMRLNTGEDFGRLVAEKSMDTVSAMNGGFIGPFDSSGYTAEGNSLVEPFTEAAFAIEKVGDITQSPVITDYGYHIIKLDEIIPGRELSFEEVEDDLIHELVTMAKDEYFQEYLYGLMESSTIVTEYENEAK